MVPRTILDTDIFSELMRGKNEVVRARADGYLKQHGQLTISAITVLEVAKGSSLSRSFRWDEMKPSSVVASMATSNGSDSRSGERIR